MKCLMVIRLIIVFAPLIQKLLGNADPHEKEQALQSGIIKAQTFFPGFTKVAEKMNSTDLRGIINLFEWFANIKDEE